MGQGRRQCRSQTRRTCIHASHLGGHREVEQDQVVESNNLLMATILMATMISARLTVWACSSHRLQPSSCRRALWPRHWGPRAPAPQSPLRWHRRRPPCPCPFRTVPAGRAWSSGQTSCCRPSRAVGHPTEETGEARARTLDHSGWWFLTLHCRETAVMKSLCRSRYQSAIQHVASGVHQRRGPDGEGRRIRTQVLANVLNLKLRSRAWPSAASVQRPPGARRAARAGATASASVPDDRRGCRMVDAGRRASSEAESRRVCPESRRDMAACLELVVRGNGCVTRRG